jgi:hypothetical protein
MVRRDNPAVPPSETGATVEFMLRRHSQLLPTRAVDLSKVSLCGLQHILKLRVAAFPQA